MRAQTSLILLFGAVVCLGAGMLLGKFLFSSAPGDLGSGIGGNQDRSSSSDTPDESAEALRVRVQVLETRLAAAEARNKKLLGKGGAKDAEAVGRARDWAGAKKDGSGKKGKGRGEKGGWGKKDRKLVRPEGMTGEEQDALVQKLVDNHDWPKTVAALRIWMNAERGGRAVSMQDKDALGDFFALLGQLGQTGVGFFDRRVARRFVPVMVSQMGTNLDQAQADRITTVVDDMGRRTEAGPEPDPPRRYAHEKARHLQQTLALEQQMASILRPDQMAAYFEEVGDDPFTSGFGFKTSRLACTGQGVEGVAAEVAGVWMMYYEIDPSLQAQVTPMAYGFVTQALAVPAPSKAGDAAARRQAVIERTKRVLELQGNAEEELVAALPLSDAHRRATFERTCPVLDLVVE